MSKNESPTQNGLPPLGRARRRFLEHERIIRDRSEALLAALPSDVPLSATRAETARSGFKSTIYSIERDRRRCAQAKPKA